MTEGEVKVSMELIRKIFDYLSDGKRKLEDLEKIEREDHVKYVEGPMEERRGIQIRTIIGEVWADRDSSGKLTRWKIYRSFSPCIQGYKDGTVKVGSVGLTSIREHINRVTYSLYEKKFDKAEKNRERERLERLMKKWKEKDDVIQRNLVGRRNLEKYMADRYLKNLVLHIKYADEVAKRVSEKYGVEVIHCIDLPPEEYDYFCSIFNAKGMSENQILEEVKKRIDAVKEAYILFSPPYNPNPRGFKRIYKWLHEEKSGRRSKLSQT
ncbi:MAG: hypothetical protein QXP19_01325 [Thermoproteota archaeon]